MEAGLIGLGGVVLGFLGAWLIERRRRHDELADRQAQDRDETRRLLLILRVTVDAYRSTTHPISPDLPATIANALSSHSGILDDGQATDFARRVVDVYISGDDDTRRTELLREIDGYIDQLR
jgi:hypothetical protein